MVIDDVRSGNVALRIRYPFHYLGYIAIEHLGMSPPTVVPFLCLAAYGIGGMPTIPNIAVALPVFVLMVVGSFLISGMLYFLMGLAAFWMEEPHPLIRIVEKIAVVLGGSVVPLALLPDVARRGIELFPMAAAGFPAQVTSPDFLEHAPRLLTIEFVWVAMLGVALAIVWRMAQRRIEVNGG